MTVSLGTMTFAYADEPDSESQLSLGANLKTSQFNPEGYSGTIVTYHGMPGNRHRLHMFMGQVAAAALTALGAARTEVLFTDTDVIELASGKNVAILECDVDKNSRTPGRSSDADYWYECNVLLVETGT